MSNKIEKLWQQLTEMITEYQSNTEDKRKQYEYLKELDNVHRADTAQYSKLHIYLQDTIKSLKQDVYALSQKRQQRITELKNQIMRMRKRIENLRRDFSMSQTQDATQLKKLTIVSTNILKVSQIFILFNLKFRSYCFLLLKTLDIRLNTEHYLKNYDLNFVRKRCNFINNLI